MHPSTEDLLSLRDREPMDAAVRTRMEASREALAEIERMNDLRDAMRALPQLTPPPGAWERIIANAEPAVVTERASVSRWRVGAVVAAAVAVVGVLSFAYLPRPAKPTLGMAPASTALSAVREDAAALTAAETPSYVALVEESVRLEQMLAGMRYQRPVMTAGTASTIAVLEDRISFIDGQLTLAALEGVEPPKRQALWRERVEVMNALVQVRFAQAQPFRY